MSQIEQRVTAPKASPIPFVSPSPARRASYSEWRFLWRTCSRRAPGTLIVVGLLGGLVAGCGQAEREDSAIGEEDQVAELSISDIGFATPESVLHDEAADIYLVSNINGGPLEKAGNGFISRLRPDGEIEELRWIDGEREGVTLHAPKGMAIKGDTLFVADIDSVRAFDRSTGASLGARGVPGATFLNDLAIGPDGTLYVSDTGLDAAFAPTGTDAVHRFDEDGPRPIAEGAHLLNPNGLVVHGESVLMVPFGGNVVWSIPAAGGAAESIATLPGGQLDGIVRIGGGVLLVSSLEAGAIYRIGADGGVTVAVEGLEAPADIGWDGRRERVLIPLFMADQVELRALR